MASIRSDSDEFSRIQEGLSSSSSESSESTVELDEPSAMPKEDETLDELLDSLGIQAPSTGDLRILSDGAKAIQSLDELKERIADRTNPKPIIWDIYLEPIAKLSDKSPIKKALIQEFHSLKDDEKKQKITEGEKELDRRLESSTRSLALQAQQTMERRELSPIKMLAGRLRSLSGTKVGNKALDLVSRATRSLSYPNLRKQSLATS